MRFPSYRMQHMQCNATDAQPARLRRNQKTEIRNTCKKRNGLYLCIRCVFRVRALRALQFFYLRRMKPARVASLALRTAA